MKLLPHETKTGGTLRPFNRPTTLSGFAGRFSRLLWQGRNWLAASGYEDG